MFRFSVKTLLFAFVLVAAWFSTFAGYRGSMDVRASVLLVVLLTAGFAALYSRGKQRAFLAGFFVVLFLNGGNLFQAPLAKYVPNFSWLSMPSSAFAPVYSAPPPVISYAPSVSSGQGQTITRFVAPVAPQAAFFPAPAAATNYDSVLAMNATIEVVWIFALGVIVGLIARWLYSTMRTEQSNA
jgi:hypothetical protein